MSTLGLLLLNCNFTGYRPTLPQKERTDSRDRARYMADVLVLLFIATANGSFLLLFFAGATKPFFKERRPYLLVHVKSSDTALHSIR